MMASWVPSHKYDGTYGAFNHTSMMTCWCSPCLKSATEITHMLRNAWMNVHACCSADKRNVMHTHVYASWGVIIYRGDHAHALRNTWMNVHACCSAHKRNARHTDVDKSCGVYQLACDLFSSFKDATHVHTHAYRLKMEVVATVLDHCEQVTKMLREEKWLVWPSMAPPQKNRNPKPRTTRAFIIVRLHIHACIPLAWISGLSKGPWPCWCSMEASAVHNGVGVCKVWW